MSLKRCSFCVVLWKKFPLEEHGAAGEVITENVPMCAAEENGRVLRS